MPDTCNHKQKRVHSVAGRAHTCTKSFARIAGKPSRSTKRVTQIADAGDELQVCEYDGTSEPTFYSLTRE